MSTSQPEPDTGDDTGPEEALGYEAAREQLVDTVAQLESGGTTLEESLALWERAEHLARTCQTFLDGARTRLDAVLDDEA
ncbi:exodeoxyribonuclease VII small subunit [Nocardioides lentus]|uniref:Exodeoxyribonuclease 7 small subunit n=1 Tax=Nocardioides lentus TaxID=338077 RepID=A0ABN2PDJ3_9ACTN